VLLLRGLMFWVPTHVPQSLVTCPGVYLPFSRAMQVVLPWLWPSHGSYLFQGLPAVAWIFHELGHPLLVLDLRPSSRLSLLLTTVLDCRGPKPLRRRPSPSGDASLWATPHLGDDSSDLPADFSSLGPSRGPHHALTLTFGQRPMTGRYTSPPVLS